MEEMLGSVLEFFQSEDWSYSRLEGQTVIKLVSTAANSRWNCFAQTREEQRQFIFYSVYPDNVPEERLAAVSEFLTRANFGLIIGNFELDLDDGEIRFKTSIDLKEASLTSGLLKQLVYPNVVTMGRYIPAIQGIIQGQQSPLEAIEALEMRP
ncbi:YbjN domain-containing protein [Paenibacillus whitsoniae]|uniref:YbjN domain-containing protein n=1 Tax=Paenibacillus whitsoniae TaxID=2496558 RepID=A0A3S0BKK8_9BACL|nr:YbjN domain-containing protein [Paenibacillus whitsoniae]RTE08645.1 YbjN domain-containing protein [Paenibacillus whitsoniae]